MNDFKYQLDKTSAKFKCPNCGKKRLVKYVNNETSEYLPDKYGRCDREVECAYSLNPYKDGFNKENQINSLPKFVPVKTKPKPLTPFPVKVFENTLKGYDHNVFVQNLKKNITGISNDQLEAIIGKYFIGTISNGKWKGSTTIPFIDIEGKIRAVQVKSFDENNHTKGTTFFHSIIHMDLIKSNHEIPKWLLEYRQNEKFVYCLFGEHLLNKYKSNPIGLVEAPKTAIYASLCFGFPSGPDDLLWLAVYNLSSLTEEKCRVLKGRKVILFPDLSKDGSAFEKWSKKAEEFSKSIPGSSWQVSDLLEKSASQYEREKGMDLADYLYRDEWGKANKNSKIKAYIKNGGQLFIDRPSETTYEVHQSITSYNRGKSTAQFVDKQSEDPKDFLPVEFDEKNNKIWF